MHGIYHFSIEGATGGWSDMSPGDCYGYSWSDSGGRGAKVET